MYLQFSLRSIECLKCHDEEFLFPNKTVELYQTWQMKLIENLTDNEEDSSFGRQGFSIRGASKDTGLNFREGVKDEGVFDPVIRFILPNLKEGESRNLRLDFHYWESDRKCNTRKIRQAFSDSTLSVFMNAIAKNNEDYDKAKAELQKYLDETDPIGVILENIEKAALANIPLLKGVKIGKGINLLFKMILASFTDEYLGTNQLEFQIKNENGQLKWRINSVAVPVIEWKKGVDRQDLEGLIIESENRRNKLRVGYQCRIID